MDSRPYEPESSLPDPCNKCKRTTGYALDNYSASICPFNICPDCREVEELDAQILKLHNLAVDLSKRRYEIKGRINARHDHFALHLPLEIVSDILALVVHTPIDRKLRKEDRGTWNPPLDLKLAEKDPGFHWNLVFKLGAVCRQWREIILDTPTLWTRLSINPLSFSSVPDLTAQWLSRCSGLPLFLEFRFGYYYHRLSEIPEALQLLKSHTSRWKDLTLLGPTDLLQTILRGMEDTIVMDSLRIDMESNRSDDSDDADDEITMKYPFAPRRLHIRTIPVPEIPVQWDRLTYLKAKYITIDSILHIIRNAPNLQQCRLHYVKDDEGHYPISTSPVTNDSVKELDLKFKQSYPTLKLLLEKLTFPALEILRFGKSEGRNVNDMNALRELLDRSQPPLHGFSFRHVSWRKTHTFYWYGILPSITSLELDLHQANKEITQNHIDSLGSHVEPMAFPRLRNLTLKIHAQNITPDWWNGLVAVFCGSETNKDTMPMISTRRPLKTVTVSIHPSLYLGYKFMDRATYSRLLAIKNSGVSLRALDTDGTDILRPDVELTFAEHDDDCDDGCRADEMGKNIEELY